MERDPLQLWIVHNPTGDQVMFALGWSAVDAWSNALTVMHAREVVGAEAKAIYERMKRQGWSAKRCTVVIP